MEVDNRLDSHFLVEVSKKEVYPLFEGVRTSGEFKHLCIQCAVQRLGGYGHTMAWLDYLQVQGRITKQEKSDIRKLINTAFSDIEERANRRFGID
ncbi:hypothetical protein [Porphyromonas gingivicanis]|nr:hypothetical protein [Porphyromonas gingivicanis]